MKKQIVFIFLISLSFSLYADVRLPSAISSHMVLQQNTTVKLWGWGESAEKIKITTSWDQKTIEVTSDCYAKWIAEIKTPKAGGPYTITFEEKNKIVLEDIMIGEVWVCGGQSNMEWSYKHGIADMEKELSQLNKLNIRLLYIPKNTAQTPQDNTFGTWMVCDSNTVKTFSAVAFFFGKKLNQDLNVPIGLISSNWGGTPAEVWTPSEVVESDSTLAKASRLIGENQYRPNLPGCTYNAMIAPITNYTIGGAIWYQGESNAETAYSYAALMEKMIGSWRKKWNYDFPFYYVQIAPFKYNKNNVGALLREAQTKNLSIKNSGMVVISDLVNDTLNIHPTNKRDVGSRLANLAMGETYKLNITGYKSPVFRSLSFNKNNAVIEFDYADSGLIMEGKVPKEIFIAGEDKVFYPAEVKIKGNSILVYNYKVKHPVAVRYQFSNAGIGNLFSKAGLPVAPFRTDTWEVDTNNSTATK